MVFDKVKKENFFFLSVFWEIYLIENKSTEDSIIKSEAN